VLVLTRRVGDTIEIGNGDDTTTITVTVVAIKGKQVRLGIQAPSHMTIKRKEMYQEVRNQNQEASQLPATSAFAAKEILRQLKDNEFPQ